MSHEQIYRNDLTNRFPTYTVQEDSSGDLKMFSLYDGGTLVIIATTTDLEASVIKVRNDLLGSETLPMSTTAQRTALTGILIGQRILNITSGVTEVYNGVDWDAATYFVWTTFIPLSGVVDSAFPLLGDFRTQATGQTADYATDFSLVNQHLFILINSITTGGDIVITGTSVSESTSVPITADTETLTIDTSTGQYYQTSKKWLEVTNIDVTSGTIASIDYDLGTLGYYDAFNAHFHFIGYRAEMRASGVNPDMRLRIRKIQNDGAGKVSLPIIEDIGFDSSAANGAIVDNTRTGGDDRSHTFAQELLDTNNQIVFKQSDFNSFFTSDENVINGMDDEGILIDLLGQGDAGISNVESMTLIFKIAY